MRDEQVKQNTTSRIINFKLRSATTGLLLTGKVAADFSGTRHIAGGTTTALSFSAGTAGDAFSSGKICPLTNGTYDWHTPDAMYTALGQSNAVISCSGAIDVGFDFEVVAVDRRVAAFGGVMPTVAGRTINIEAGGRAGINWADIANPTQNVTLSGTIVIVSAVQTGGIVAGSFGAGAINAAALATDACDEIADHVWDEILSGHVSAGSTGEALSAAGGAGDPWITALPGAYGAGTAGKIIGDNINATISSRASQSSVDTIDDFLDTEIAAIKAKTDNLPTDPADQSAVEAAITAATSPLATAANLATVAGYLDTEIAAILADTNELQTDWANGGRLDLILDARASQTSIDDLPTNAELATALTGVFTTQMTESYAADGVAPTPAQALFLIQQAITEFSISSTTTTIKKIDGTTTAATLTLNSATTPTAVTRST